MSQLQSNKALIIGGGIAGPAMALQLQKIGIQSTIFESRYEHDMNQGVFLGITPNGLNILQEFFDLEILKQDYTPGKMCFYNAQNKKIGELDTQHQLKKYGAETLQVKRTDISAALRKEVVENGIPINYGKKLVHLEQHDQVTAYFSDGTSASADFLIASDGAHSVVRSKLFPDAPSPVYTKQLSTGAFVHMPDMKPHFGFIKMTFGKSAFFAYAVSNKGEVWWFNNFYREQEPKREEMATTLQQEIKSHLLHIHKEDPEPILEIIRSTDEIFAYPIYDIPSLSKWHQGKICLIGDAAHATSPHIGQGASLALEDTAVLAKCIRNEADLTTAFEKFQQIRQPRVEKLIKTARKIGNSKSKPNPVATFFRDLLLRHFIKFEIKKMDWIYNYTCKWNGNEN